jgi:hypothetical protein
MKVQLKCYTVRQQKLCLKSEGLTTEEFPQIAQRIQIIDRKKTATRSWGYIVPQVPTIRSPYQ